jgi:hypothetical protein
MKSKNTRLNTYYLLTKIKIINLKKRKTPKILKES